MGMFGSLFGTEKAVDNILDNEKGLLVRAGTALGNLYYSDQEKAEDSEKTREWGIRLLDSLAPFKVVQRMLAFAVMFSWIFMLINVVVAGWIYAITSVTVTVVKDGVTTTTVSGVNAYDIMWQVASSDFVFWPVMSIFVLYTGGGTINSLKGGK